MKNIITISFIISLLINLVLIYKLIDTSISLTYANSSLTQNIRESDALKKIINMIAMDNDYKSLVEKVKSSDLNNNYVVKINPNSIEIDEITLVFKNGVLSKLKER